MVAILQATPNPGADTGSGRRSCRGRARRPPSTGRLVQELRDRSPGWEQELGVTDVLVAGTTAVNIDVSKKLGDALLPFAAIVIGLSIVLLMIVFRSIAVPIKATLGYLLSVGAALGAVVAAFQWGWLDPFMGESAGPIVSFLPIFVMGVLFGLAMDYEMFLVSAMREEYVRHGRPHAAAIINGFKASSVVVTAAAAIMTVGLHRVHPGRLVDDQADRPRPGRRRRGRRLHRPDDAGAGRHDDAGPAGRGGCPRWLDRMLPEVDVEGAALHRKIDYEEWAAETGPTAVHARGLVLTPRAPTRSTSSLRPAR